MQWHSTLTRQTIPVKLCHTTYQNIVGDIRVLDTQSHFIKFNTKTFCVKIYDGHIYSCNGIELQTSMKFGVLLKIGTDLYTAKARIIMNLWQVIVNYLSVKGALCLTWKTSWNTDNSRNIKKPSGDLVRLQFQCPKIRYSGTVFCAETCRGLKSQIRCTMDARTNLHHHNAIFWGPRRAVLKVYN